MKRRTTARQVVGFAVLGILIAFVLSVAGLRAQTAAPAAKPVAKTPAVATTLPLKVAAGVRMKFQDFVKDKRRLDALVKAIEVMKSRTSASTSSADYRRSWEYWSSMHGFYGPQAKAGLLQDAIDDAPATKKPFFKGLRDLTFPPQPPGLAQQVWDKCQHGTPQFLTWHRAFLFYFERVLQQAAQDNTLRLPYWDYTDPTQLQLPAQFGQPTLNGKANSLFDPRRRSQTVKLDSNATNIDNLLKKASYNTFRPEIEQQPHGYVHCAVGPDCPYPLMGDVPVAGTDPIFWLHHANIDRIFECWLKLGGKVPDNLKSIQYAFIDNAGNLVKIKYSDVPIDYTYDHVTNCGRKPTLQFSPAAVGVETAATQLAKVEGVALNAVKVAARLKVPPRPEGAPPAKTTELVLENITLEGPPGVLYNVYLETTGANPRRQYVATISFFGLDHHHGKGKGGGTLTRNVDVTDALNALKGSPNAQLPEVQVKFEATTDGTVGAAPEAVNPKAALRVGAIKLQTKDK